MWVEGSRSAERWCISSKLMDTYQQKSNKGKAASALWSQWFLSSWEACRVHVENSAVLWLSPQCWSCSETINSLGIQPSISQTRSIQGASCFPLFCWTQTRRRSPISSPLGANMRCKVVWCSHPGRVSAEGAVGSFPWVWKHEQFVNNTSPRQFDSAVTSCKICHWVHCSHLSPDLSLLGHYGLLMPQQLGHVLVT